MSKRNYPPHERDQAPQTSGGASRPEENGYSSQLIVPAVAATAFRGIETVKHPSSFQTMTPEQLKEFKARKLPAMKRGRPLPALSPEENKIIKTRIEKIDNSLKFGAIIARNGRV